MRGNRKKIFDFLDQFGLDALVADGFDEAIVGVVVEDDYPKVVYDSYKCIDILVEGGMKEDEAAEYFDYNVVGSYVGEQTPIFIYPISKI